MTMKFTQTEIETIVLWTLVNGLVWFLGTIGVFVISILWIGFLINHVPGEPRLGTWLPGHEHMGWFIGSAMGVSGVLLGFVVGLGQWLVLAKRYALSWHWIKVSTLAWALGGAAGGFLITATYNTGPTHLTLDRLIHTITALLISLVGGSVSGGWLARTYGKQADQRRFFRISYASAWVVSALLIWGGQLLLNLNVNDSLSGILPFGFISGLLSGVVIAKVL
jgi:hypothetical protein